MDRIELYCKECDEKKEFEIIDVQEGDDCWKVFTVKCTKCGYIKEVKFYN